MKSHSLKKQAYLKVYVFLGVTSSTGEDTADTTFTTHQPPSVRCKHLH